MLPAPALVPLLCMVSSQMLPYRMRLEDPKGSDLLASPSESVCRFGWRHHCCVNYGLQVILSEASGEQEVFRLILLVERGLWLLEG